MFVICIAYLFPVHLSRLAAQLGPTVANIYVYIYIYIYIAMNSHLRNVGSATDDSCLV